MIHIRTMTAEDVPLGMRLKAQARFNQTEADWRRFLDLGPDGCFVAELDGEPVGTVTNCLFGSVGWIAMLLVDERVRGRGIGTRLLEHALVYLDARGARCARLDATPRGRPIYEKLGFVAEYELARWEGPATAGESAEERPQDSLPLPWRERAGVRGKQQLRSGSRPSADAEGPRPITAELLGAVVELDQQVTGTPRRRLIERLYQECPEAMQVIGTGDAIVAYLTFRAGSNAAQIGPGAALSDAAGRALGDAAIERCAGHAVFVDVPVDNALATRWAESKGLVVQRCFTRMRRGEPVVDRPSQIWASSGPEKG